MQETDVKENSKVLRLCVSGMLVVSLTEIGGRGESKKELFVERKQESGKMDFTCAFQSHHSR